MKRDSHVDSTNINSLALSRASHTNPLEKTEKIDLDFDLRHPPT